MHTFPKGINILWNINSLVQGLSSGHRLSSFIFGKVQNVKLTEECTDKYVLILKKKQVFTNMNLQQAAWVEKTIHDLN